MCRYDLINGFHWKYIYNVSMYTSRYILHACSQDTCIHAKIYRHKYTYSGIFMSIKVVDLSILCATSI